MQKIMFNDRYGLTDAVLRGSKTQTRRIVYDFRKHASNKVGKCVLLNNNNITYMDGKMQVLDELPKPKYEVGEAVAVAQSYKDCIYECIRETGLDATIKPYLAKEAGYKNKMFVKAERMPHHIRITGIRVQRLQDISDEDCMKEGIFEDSGDNAFPPPIFYDYPNNRGNGFDSPREAYAALIDRVSGKVTWASNPFVVAYDFELID